jgi:hypothetical protein
MSFLKQLLTPFVEFDEEKKQQTTGAPSQSATAGQAANVPSPAPPSVPRAVTPGSATPPVAPATPEANAQHPLINPGPAPAPPAGQTPTYAPGGGLTAPMPEHERYFEKLIDEANLKNPIFQGTDYKEFVDSKVDIDDITDETIRYRTAFNVLKSTGLTKEKLLATGQEYLNLIGRDLNAFQSAHSQKYGKEVRQKELQIQKKAEELQQLTQKISALKAEINTLTQDITITKEQLGTTKNSFLLAGENKQKEIQTELEKIAQYF